jgi:hypothetical protein
MSWHPNPLTFIVKASISLNDHRKTSNTKHISILVEMVELKRDKQNLMLDTALQNMI